MSTWEQTDRGVRVLPAAVSIVGDWQPEERRVAPPDDRRMDAAAAGTATSLQFPAGPAAVTVGGRWREVVDRRDCDGGLLVVNGPGEVELDFDGQATVGRDEAGRAQATFPERTPVTLRYRDPANWTVRVPETPAGAATYVTHAAAAHRADGAARSAPGTRTPPPRVAVGETRVPDVVADARPPSPLAVHVPPSMEAVAVVAPLAYYLGASVELDTRGEPRVAGPGTDVSLDPLAERPAALLRRLFAHDRRNRGDDRPAGERLRDTAGAPDPGTWHLAAYVDDEVLRALPAALDRLAAVYPAAAETLSPGELVERSLDAFYRGADDGTVRLVDPDLRGAALHAWVPSGAPLDAYRAPATGVVSRYRRDGPLRVAVVGNDPEMDAETAEAAAAYRGAGAAVTEYAELPCRELADLFGGGPDALHFVGHCEEGGLRCPDGTLALDDLPSNEVETFFLNACGSYREGLALVRSGSVAGTVTTRDVLDEQATTVGAAFARLLARGFSVERATRLARQQVIMGTDYLAVGAATRAPVGREPSVYRVDQVEAGYRVVHEAPPETEPGGTCRVPAGVECDRRPRGTDRVATLGRAALRELLARVDDPVVYGGDLTWPGDLRERV